MRSRARSSSILRPTNGVKLEIEGLDAAHPLGAVWQPPLLIVRLVDEQSLVVSVGHSPSDVIQLHLKQTSI